MGASSNLIGDVGTVISNGPSSTTLGNCIAAAGPINDYKGNCNLLQLRLEESSVLLGEIKYDTDSTDSTNLSLINGIIAALNGTTSPSTSVITDIKSVISNGPNAATKAKAIAAAGKIQDYPGNCNLVLGKLQEAQVQDTFLHTLTDNATDSANRTLLANVLLTLS